MPLKHKLALGALVGAALAAAGPASAQTAQVSSQLNSLQQQIQALQAQIQTLQSQVKDADATANKAVTVAAANAPPLVVTPPPVGWWQNTSVSGRMYFDLTDIESKTNGVSNAQNGTSFDIKRFYIGIDHKFNDTWSANVTTDFLYDSTAGATQLYLKKAYLQGKWSDALTVRIGSADMPWIPFVEDVYGYRYVENTLVDRIKYGNSADWGVNALGKFGSDVVFEYSASVVNGAGYKKPGVGLGTNRSAGMDFEGRADVRFDDFVVAVGGYDGDRGMDLGSGTAHHDAQRFDALAAYTGNGFHVGVEYFYDDNWDSVAKVAEDHGDGWSGFASYQFTPQWALFGRYDSTSPLEGAAYSPKFTNDYYNVGVEFTPTKIVNLSLVYKHDDGSNGTLTDSNGTIGGSSSGKYDEIGLFGQFRW